MKHSASNGIIWLLLQLLLSLSIHSITGYHYYNNYQGYRNIDSRIRNSLDVDTGIINSNTDTITTCNSIRFSGGGIKFWWQVL